ncbi:MAG: leucyl/phenylalanyl-tRNA--protein transferase [Bdellovibrio sp.]|nr:MAG: leucyl/phenylalanyl-tRNA--protein transferase [Bdellovibrio sp.]
MPHRFPDPADATGEGLVAVGGQLDPQTLLTAYGQGIFPWPQPDTPMLWFSPDPRGVLVFKDLHISRSLRRAQKKLKWEFTVNQAFDRVIQACAGQPRPGQNGTWITPEVIAAYRRLFARGHVLSVECWEGEEVVGGIYGVITEKYFSAESMFHLRPNASKLCLLELVGELRRRGHAWMDVQMITPVVAALGGKYIPRKQFLIWIAGSTVACGS